MGAWLTYILIENWFPLSEEHQLSIAPVLVRVLLLWRDTMIKATTYLGPGYSFRGSVHYHNRKHSSVQADMVLEEPKALHLDLKSARCGGGVGVRGSYILLPNSPLHLTYGNYFLAYNCPWSRRDCFNNSTNCRPQFNDVDERSPWMVG
jgi:hypothetical protein